LRGRYHEWVHKLKLMGNDFNLIMQGKEDTKMEKPSICLKLLSIVFIILLACAPMISSQLSYAAEKEKRIAIGGGSTGGGTYFLVSTAMASIISKYSTIYLANAQNTGGGPQNINLLKMKKVHLGLAANLQAEDAYKGTGEFKGNQVPELRAVTGGYQYGVYFLVSKDSPIKTYKDVVGKSICVGPHGGSFWPDVKYHLLYGYGVNFSDFKPMYLAYGHAIDSLRDGRVDGTFNPCGTEPATRAGAVVDIASTGSIKFVSITDEAIEKIRKEIPSYIPVTIPPNFFANQNYTFKTLATPTLVVSRADVEDEMVYDFVKTLYDRKKEFMEIYAGSENYVNPEKLKYITIPLHPGAVKFYKEIGLGKYLP
jgi:TRAP transporter TAXI family solute receptor